MAARALEGIHTKLYGPLNAPFFTYNTVPWTLHVRKEVLRFIELLKFYSIKLIISKKYLKKLARVKRYWALFEMDIEFSI